MAIGWLTDDLVLPGVAHRYGTIMLETRGRIEMFAAIPNVASRISFLSVACSIAMGTRSQREQGGDSAAYITPLLSMLKRLCLPLPVDF
ncbi:hypothetical protein [Agrobacterium sp. SORGH_AS 787]|uniref:hypothetical protein n=1 Tax=Agrobacterium sp. SORGH_AS 787 TaxID=3041775 RepID=UPI002786CF4D|nr:hypothetical protein [Rhizobium sp. SORGH_AS_0787]